MITGIQPNQIASMRRGLHALFPRGHRQNLADFNALKVDFLHNEDLGGKKNIQHVVFITNVALNQMEICITLEQPIKFRSDTSG